MNQRFDAVCREMRLQRVSIARSYDEQMIDVAVVALRQQIERRAGKTLAITCGQRAPAISPALQPRQPRAQDSRLEVVQAGVDAWLLVMIPIDLSAVSQPLHAVGQR